jgi:hypothetical protein
MKRILTVLSAALLWLALGVPALAQVQGFPANHPWFTNPQSAAFQQFLAGHPNIAQELSANPGNLYNPNWRGQYPQLQSYLQANPGVWTGLRGQGASLYDPGFSGFLAHHPGVSRDLASNPELLYDPRFRAAHPELQAWLAGHPSMWRSMKYQGLAAPVAPMAPVYGRYPAGYGDWDENHVWRDPDWWEDHHPEWVRKHHPEWAEWRAKHEGQFEHHEAQAEKHAWHEQEKAEKREQHHDHGGDHHGHDRD